MKLYNYFSSKKISKVPGSSYFYRAGKKFLCHILLSFSRMKVLLWHQYQVIHRYENLHRRNLYMHISNENLFRLIFETQIHIHIHIRYFKSLPIATYHLSRIYIKYLYLHSKTYSMDLKWNLYLTSLSRHDPVNPSTPIFGNINLTERMTNLIVAWKINQKRLQESLCAL